MDEFVEMVARGVSPAAVVGEIITEAFTRAGVLKTAVQKDQEARRDRYWRDTRVKTRKAYGRTR